MLDSLLGGSSRFALLTVRWRVRVPASVCPSLQAETKEAEEIFRRYSVFDHFTLGAQLSAMPDVGTRIIIYNLRKEEEKEENDSDDDDDEEVQRRQMIKVKQEQADAKKKAVAAAAAAGSAGARDDDSSYELKWVGLHGDLEIVVAPASNMRERPNQMSTDVPCDYSLRAYLAMLFRDEAMQMFIRGVRVEHFEWERFLTQTRSYPCSLPRFKNCTLLLGFSEVERERGNAGLVLYWHATLIESYRRVCVQCGSSDAGLGVVGVFDVGEALETQQQQNGVPAVQQALQKTAQMVWEWETDNDIRVALEGEREA